MLIRNDECLMNDGITKLSYEYLKSAGKLLGSYQEVFKERKEVI